jgi:hypothetical protein
MECIVRISMCYRIKVIKEYKRILTSHGPKGVTRVSISREAMDGIARNKLWKNGKTITHGPTYHLLNF